LIYLATTLFLPSQCLTYTTITDGFRNFASTSTSYVCDNVTFITTSIWMRFSGDAGTQLATSAVLTYLCGTHATGYYTGLMSSSLGNTTTGSVCHN
jgi:hypothetical protein